MLKKFFEFLQQAFLGDSKGLGSKTANMTVDQLVKVGTDMEIDKATAEKMVTAFLTKNEDKVLADINTSLADVKKLSTTDDMIESEYRAEYIDGKGADTMSFDEFKLMKEDESKKAAREIIAKEDPPNEFFDNPNVLANEDAARLAEDQLNSPFAKGAFSNTQKERKVGAYATRPEDVSNYDELVRAGHYIEGTMKPGPNHPFNQPQKVSETLFPGDKSQTSIVASNISQWKQDLMYNLDEGIITRDEYDMFYRKASPIFDAEYAKAKQIDSQNGFVENTYDNRNAENLMTDYWPGENYRAKYLTEEDIAATGYSPSADGAARSKEINDKVNTMLNETLFEPIKTETKILNSQRKVIDDYYRAMDEAIEVGDIEEANRIRDIINDAVDQQGSGVDLTEIIFKDNKRTLNAMGGIIQGVKNRGRR
jgi:hypothetical protein